MKTNLLDDVDDRRYVVAQEYYKIVKKLHWTNTNW